MSSDPLSPPLPRVSLRDVARDVGVSHVTVSLALRGDRRISEARRRAITAAANRLGYRPDPMLSSLAAYRRSKGPITIQSTIAWLNQWENPKALRRLREFEAYWEGARAAAEQLGYRLEEFILSPDLPAGRLQKILLTRDVRGLLIPPHKQGFSLPEFDWSLYSIVRLGVSVKHPRAHVVTSDQSGCASLAFERAWERGYRRIGYVSSHMFDVNTGGNFRAGYLASQDAHVPLRAHLSLLLLEENAGAANAAALQRWLKRFRPDAIVTALPDLPELLQKVGCRVPDDVGVATLSVLDGRFDTGVDQNSREIGRVALSTLAGLIHQNERGVPQYFRRILVEGRWIDGSSLLPRSLRV